MPTVLLLEDNPAYAQLTTLLLEDAAGEGVEVQHVTTLAEAEGLAGRADCVVMDLTLPDGEGLPAVERLRAAAPATPVIVLSGREPTPSLRQALEDAGAVGYVLKGLEDEELGPALKRALPAV